MALLHAALTVPRTCASHSKTIRSILPSPPPNKRTTTSMARTIQRRPVRGAHRETALVARLTNLPRSVARMQAYGLETAQSPYSEFHLFMKLPVEIRGKIWKLLFPTGRDIDLSADYLQNPTTMVHLFSPLLRTSHESRAAFMDKYLLQNILLDLQTFDTTRPRPSQRRRLSFIIPVRNRSLSRSFSQSPTTSKSPFIMARGRPRPTVTK